MLFVSLIISHLLGSCVAHDERSRVVHTAQGPVRGYSHPQGDFFAFYSIPYATAPTGQNRFKGPMPPLTRQDTLEAVDTKTVCPQPKLLLQAYGMEEFKMEEDCLIANIFVPDTEETNLSVVVYIHGGGFQVGFGNMIMHLPFLNMGKIIVVTINYRLSAHGFLCLGTEDIPGNTGMKDQVAALHWIKQNIAGFGGNPNNIALAGYSAGAAAVELLSLSRSTRGLFSKVILESGSSLAVWAILSDPLESAKSFAKSLGYAGAYDINSLETFFKNQSLNVLQIDIVDRPDSALVFSPCVEREGTEGAFLTDAPMNIIKKGEYEKLPTLAGFADMEGLVRLPNFEQWIDGMNEKFSDFLPVNLHFSNEDERNKTAKRLKEFYFGKQQIGKDSALGFVNYQSDLFFVNPALRSMLLQLTSGSSSQYLYMYAFVDDSRPPYPYTGLTGAEHSSQTSVLGVTIWSKSDAELSVEYRSVKRLLVDVWTNFIISGKPTPEGSYAADVFGGEWEPVSHTRQIYGLFNTCSELRAQIWPDRMALWDDIYSKYYLTPIPPPKSFTQSKTEL